MKKVTNAEIYKKLVFIEGLMKSMLHKEIKELHIIGIEKKDVEKLLNEKLPRIFDDITQWKLRIWDNCPFRKNITDATEVRYMCEKINKPCNFTNCPKNKL